MLTHLIMASAATLLFSTAAKAEPDHHQHKEELGGRGDHDDHQQHDHADHDHHEKDAKSENDDNAAGAALTKTPEIEAALAEGGEPVVVDILGVVCDFCAKAMNKTFGKREEVAATYVDLDTKALSLALKPGAALSDETITKLVKRAGYKASAIRRGEAALRGASDAANDS